MFPHKPTTSANCGDEMIGFLWAVALLKSEETAWATIVQGKERKKIQSMDSGREKLKKKKKTLNLLGERMAS